MSIERPQRDIFNFILKRAFRKGVIKRGDILSAYEGNISETRASELLSAALDKYPQYLKRHGYSVVLASDAEPPSVASEGQLMEAIYSGNDTFADIGLTESELPRQRVEWTNNSPVSPGIFSTICTAITNETALTINYVTLKKGDTGSTRSLFPVGLQRVGDQWRLVAFDLKKNPPSQRVFVMSRILDASQSDVKVPKSLRYFSFNASVLIKTPLNTELTRAQHEVMQHELSIDQNQRRMPATEEFEFLRRYGNTKVSDQAVWPIIVKGEPEHE